MQAMAIEGRVFFSLMFVVLGLALTNGVLWIILHNLLYKKMDQILFIEPYFSHFELEAYSSWPLSMIKTMIYLFLITAPEFSRKRRFKGFTQELSVSMPIRLASAICVSLLFLTALCGVLLFLYGGFLYLLNAVY